MRDVTASRIRRWFGDVCKRYKGDDGIEVGVLKAQTMFKEMVLWRGRERREMKESLEITKKKSNLNKSEFDLKLGSSYLYFTLYIYVFTFYILYSFYISTYS